MRKKFDQSIERYIFFKEYFSRQYFVNFHRANKISFVSLMHVIQKQTVDRGRCHRTPHEHNWSTKITYFHNYFPYLGSGHNISDGRGAESGRGEGQNRGSFFNINDNQGGQNKF